jgi:hypothetical protein
MAPGRDDLCVAALVFLQGSEPPAGGQRGHVSIGQGAVERVADALAECDPTARSAIAGAVARYRRDGSWRSREAVIEAVTAAVVPVAGG